MYNIKVKKGNWTSERSNMVFKAVCFAVDEYDLRQELKFYPLKIVLTKFKGDYYGDSWMHETGYEIRLNSRYNDKRIVKSVFHEMTHVKQFAFDGLKMGSRVDEFKGKKYRRVDYWDAPWEVEARQMEKFLLAKWKKVIDTTCYF
jgi:hypothetical protein